jgi:moderate conductance mechanosensitive channel
VDEELRTDPDYKEDILEPIEVLGLDEFASSAVIIKARTTTKPIKSPARPCKGRAK